MFATPKRGAKILVVDDEPTVRRFVVAALQSNGFTVLQASSGQEGLNYFIISQIVLSAVRAEFFSNNFLNVKMRSKSADIFKERGLVRH